MRGKGFEELAEVLNRMQKIAALSGELNRLASS